MRLREDVTLGAEGRGRFADGGKDHETRNTTASGRREEQGSRSPPELLGRTHLDFRAPTTMT